MSEDLIVTDVTLGGAAGLQPARRRPSPAMRIPAAFAGLLAELLSEHHVDPSPLLQASGVSPLALESGALISTRAWTRLVRLALDEAADPGLGIEFGLRLRIGSRGFLGHGVSTASTLRDAITLASHNFCLHLRPYTLVLGELGDTAFLRIEGASPIECLRPFFRDGLLCALSALPGSFIGERNHLSQVWFQGAEPLYFDRYRHRLPPARFLSATNQVRFPRYLLDCAPIDPLVAGSGSALADAACTRDVVARVRAQLRSPQNGYPEAGKMALSLGIGAKTFSAELEALGTPYRGLLEEARQRDARELLSLTSLSPAAVAERLGYARVDTFSRDFKRWTGETPHEFRRVAALLDPNPDDSKRKRRPPLKPNFSWIDEEC